MSEEECFCEILNNEVDISNYRECSSCDKKYTCQYCLHVYEGKTCCENIKKTGSYKNYYYSKGEIEFEICKEHTSYQAHYVCFDCQQYICSICREGTQHRDHRVILIDSLIKIQKRNIENQKQNLENVLSNIKEKMKELELKKLEMKEYSKNLRKKEESNMSRFSEIVGQCLEAKKKEIENKSVGEILQLRKELVTRKNDLEIRKKYNENFLKFIKDEKNVNVLPFIEDNHFFEENCEFAEEIKKKIDHNKKYHYNKLELVKSGKVEEFKVKEIPLKDKIEIEGFRLSKNLINYELR